MKLRPGVGATLFRDTVYIRQTKGYLQLPGNLARSVPYRFISSLICVDIATGANVM